MEITKESLANLYLANMGRTMASAGLDYWTNTGIYDGQDGRPSGTVLTTMEELSVSFANQAEYAKLYPVGTTEVAFVNQIFQNLFQRDASSSWWADEITTGRTTRAEAVMSIISGATGDDALILANRAAVAIDLAENLNLSSEIAMSGDVTDGLLGITADSSSVATQKDMLNIIISTTNVENTIGATSNSASYGVSSLASGSYWDLTANRDITYSFNTSVPSSYYDYGNNEKLTQNWTELDEAQKSAVGSIFDRLEKLLDVSFTEVADTSAQSDGDIQLNIIDMNEGVAGFSFYPSSYYSYSGDIFLSSEFNKNPSEYGLNSGEWGWTVIVHELGHALGLEHPFDSYNSTVLPTEYDDINHTVMSYTHRDMVLKFDYKEEIGVSYKAQFLNADFYSLYDIAALQSVYGVNRGTDTEDTIYRYNYTDYSINTIWDAGGVDTIDLSSSIGSSVIDMRGGSLNSVDQYTKEQIVKMHQDLIGQPRYDSGIEKAVNDIETNYGLYTGKNNLGIATGTIIENVNTGLGDDVITDNEANNHINSGAGDDVIYVGNGGYDTVIGGDGNDKLYINLLQSDVTVDINDNYSLIYSDNYGVRVEGIEQIVFSDGSSLWM